MILLALKAGLGAIGRDAGNICDLLYKCLDGELNGLSKHVNVYCCVLQLLG